MTDPTSKERAKRTKALILRMRLGEREAVAEVAAAIQAAGGDCKRAGEDLGVSRETIYRWRQAHPALQAAATAGRIAALTRVAPDAPTV